MRTLSGTFMAPASGDIYLCIGFVPDWVKVYTGTNANEEQGVWSVNFRSANMLAGFTQDDDGAISPDTFETGIQPYRGGDLVTSAMVTAANYLVKDPAPNKQDAGTGAAIVTWTLDTSGNRTGHWNDVCNTTSVGMGSRINVDGKWYTVVALTSNGEQADEVTLSEAAASGDILFLSGMYDYISYTVNKVTAAGFWIDSTSDLLNATSEITFFEAGRYM